MGKVDQAALESDARMERMDRVAVLFAEITAATRAFLALLAESDRHRDWEEEGFGSCAEWLAWRIGITRGTANEKVRAALALEDLPLISVAMERGELSFSKVRAVTRIANRENENELLELARAGSAAYLERQVRQWKTLSHWDEQKRERLRHWSRYFSVFPDEDGMYVVRGRLDPEVGAALMRAVETASDALFVRSDGGGEAASAGDPPSSPEETEVPEPDQRRADAVGLISERALAAGFGDAAPLSGSRAERYQVMLHVEAATLTADEEPGMSGLEDGARIAAETARRLACDASPVVVCHEPRASAPDANRSVPVGDRSVLDANRSRLDVGRSVLDVGRKTRTIPPALRRALESRDRGCRFPGCGLRFTDAHHIVHWADGGETKLENCLLLCRSHHRRVHEGGYQVCSDRNGLVVFFTPTGKALFEAPPLPQLPVEPVKELVHGNRERGIVPDPWCGAPKWQRDHDIPWEIEAAAMDALDPCDDAGVREPAAEKPAVWEPSDDKRSAGTPSDVPDPKAA